MLGYRDSKGRSRAMEILLCTSEIGLDAGGLALHCEQLKKIFTDLGHTVHIEVILKPSEYYVIDGGYDLELGNKICYAYKLKQMIKKYKNRVDLCISCGAGRTAYYSMLFCKEKNIPLYIVLCGSEVNLSWEKVDLAFYNKEAFAYTSQVIGLSEELLKNAKRYIGNRSVKYRIIPLICQMENNNGNEIIEKKEYSKVVYASGASFLGEKKGIANLLLAFSDLINNLKRDDILYLFGKIDDDIKKQYLEIIINNSLENNVYLCGYLPRKDYIKKMKEVDVYIQASPFEGFGMSVAEAVNEGKDILISDTGYIAEMIGEKFQNHIMDSLNPADMSKSIYRFSEEIIIKNDKSAIRRLLSNLLSEDSVVSQWKEVLLNNQENIFSRDKCSCCTVMFHDVDSMYSGVDYAKEGFERLIQVLFENNYKLCSVKEYFSAIDKENRIICTFDDGYENVYKNALPIMKRYGFTATVYICPDLIGKNNLWNHRDEINRRHLDEKMVFALVESGWEIGSHGLSHMNMIRLSDHELEKCLFDSKDRLEKFGKIDSFCYPYGVFNLFIKEKVKKYYSNAFSVTVGGNDYRNDMYQITRLTPEALIDHLELSSFVYGEVST